MSASPGLGRRSKSLNDDASDRRRPRPAKVEGNIFESAVVDRKVNNFLKSIRTGVKSGIQSAVKAGKVMVLRAR